MDFDSGVEPRQELFLRLRSDWCEGFRGNLCALEVAMLCKATTVTVSSMLIEGITAVSQTVGRDSRVPADFSRALQAQVRQQFGIDNFSFCILMSMDGDFF